MLVSVGVLSQERHPIAFFSKKLYESRRVLCLGSDLETLAPLLNNEFILFTNHDSLRHLNSQSRLNAKRARWFNYLGNSASLFDTLLPVKIRWQMHSVDDRIFWPHLLSMLLVLKQWRMNMHQTNISRISRRHCSPTHVATPTFPYHLDSSPKMVEFVFQKVQYKILSL